MRHRMATVALAASAMVLSACGGDDLSGRSTTAPTSITADATTIPAATTTSPDTARSASDGDAHAASSTVPESSAPDSTVLVTPTSEPVDLGTVVVLGEEGVLADVLALGVPVVASSATVAGEGFQGMAAYDTAGIEIFDYLTISLEELAAYRADVIITWGFIVDRVGAEALTGGGATLVTLPDGSSGRERLRQLGEFFGRDAAAEELIAELDSAYVVGRGAVPRGCDVSVVAVYPGANVAAFARPVWDVPRALDELGCRLVPGPDEVDTDGNGRAFLSHEQLGMLSASELITLQTDTVEGERAAVAEIESSGLWAQLPAVLSGRVTELDRLGYPGVTGEIRLVGDLVATLRE